MLSNYFTLVHVARFIHQQCAGCRISELYSQHKQQLCISVDSHPAQTIIISCEGTGNYLYLREGNYRARKNSVDLFTAAAGKQIRSVACESNDRVVILELENDVKLECEMFGARANVLFRKEGDSGTVIESFLKKKEPGQRREATSYSRLMKSEELFLDSLRLWNEEGILISLKKSLPVLGSILAKEILLRSETLPSAATLLLSDRALKRIASETATLIGEVSAPIANGQARIYYEGQSPTCFSLIPLRLFERSPHEAFSNVSAAVQRFVSSSRASSTFADNKTRIEVWLEKEEKKAAQTLQKISAERETHDRAGEYELSGKLIMANLYDLRKGLKTVSLADTITHSGKEHTIAISLEPGLTPVQNAERYFGKAKKARSAQDDFVLRSRTLGRRLSILQMLRDELSEVHAAEALRQFEQTYKSDLQNAGYMTTKEEENLPPFRVFTVEGGFQVLAGKSSENNDLLTTKFAKPNDLWFHCRGASGSHVVLKTNSARGEPSKTAVHQAASIAAYYSKMKNASTVPVVMTEKKFVHKPKGAPVGTVVLDREKVIFVQPKLPYPSNE